MLTHASKAEKQATKASYSGIRVFIEAPNVGKEALLGFASKEPLSKISTQGVISEIHVLTQDGWVMINP